MIKSASKNTRSTGNKLGTVAESEERPSYLKIKYFVKIIWAIDSIPLFKLIEM